MTVDIANFSGHRTNYPRVSDKNFERTYGDYLVITTKLVKKVAPKIQPGLLERILRSDDIMSNLATQVMFADWRWDGRGTRWGYRKQCMEWAIFNYIERASRHEPFLSLEYSYMSTEDMDFKSTLADNRYRSTEEDIDRNDYIKNLLEKSPLTKRQKECIELHYLKEKTYREIGSILGISCVRAHQLVRGGLKTIREYIKETNGH